ncbi:MAG: hypothetical protein ACLQAH_03805 [Limisphaerales bacterium]
MGAAVANIWINYLGKGSVWDIYTVVEPFWVLCSIVVVTICASMRRLVIAIIVLLFLDSFVDKCAMGDGAWWGGPPLLVMWKWNAPDCHKLIHDYWAATWTIQVPLRCVAMARMVSGGWTKQCFMIALGLNVIWFTAPQDVLFNFVWSGPFDIHYPYFTYMPPQGFWNLWNMLILRVPIGVGVGALLIRAAKNAVIRRDAA